MVAGADCPSRKVGGVRRWLRSRLFGIVSAVILAILFLGCMSFTIGGRTYEHDAYTNCYEDGLYVQRGKIRIPANSEQDVYYPVAYEHPPNVVLEDDHDDCAVIDQQADHFRVRNNGLFRETLSWCARGTRSPAVVGPTVTLPAQPAPASPSS
jgi:hypothetical protein